MKFTSYIIRMVGSIPMVYAGQAAGDDLQGGLEEVLLNKIEEGHNRIAINLNGLKYFHSTLLAGLLNLDIHAKRSSGFIILVQSPWFVKTMMDQMGISERFIWLNEESPLYMLERLEKAFMSNPEGNRDIERKLENIVG